MLAVLAAINPEGLDRGRFLTSDAESATDIVEKWTDGAGCNAVIEVTDLLPIDLTYAKK